MKKFLLTDGLEPDAARPDTRTLRFPTAGLWHCCRTSGICWSGPQKAATYDREQAVQWQVTEELVMVVLDSTLGLDELLNDFFLQDLHARLRGDKWGLGWDLAKTLAQHRFGT